jgi:hypothetical protein
MLGDISKQFQLYFCAHKSPGSEFYNYGDCGLQNFDMNSYIRTQTSNLDIWSTIRVRVYEYDFKGVFDYFYPLIKDCFP